MPACHPSCLLVPLQAHAFLSAIGFGILMPIGILVARHMKVWADPLWYYTHAVAQILGYVVGVAGWSIGIWLKLRYGDISLAPSYQIAHYGIGLAIFCSTTVQVSLHNSMCNSMLNMGTVLASISIVVMNTADVVMSMANVASRFLACFGGTLFPLGKTVPLGSGQGF